MQEQQAEKLEHLETEKLLRTTGNRYRVGCRGEVFSWGSSGGYLGFVVILASSVSRKLRTVVEVPACKGTVGRGDLF